MSKSIDLLKGLKTEDNKFLQKLFKWSLTQGRVLVLIIEIVVILLLITKFTLEKSVDKAYTQVFGYKGSIESFGTLEQQYKDYQKRLEMIDKIISSKGNLPEVLGSLQENIPKDVVLQDLLITPNLSNIMARTQNTKAFAKLTNNLLNMRGVQKLILKSAALEDAERNEYLFIIDIITSEDFFKKNGS